MSKIDEVERFLKSSQEHGGIIPMCTEINDLKVSDINQALNKNSNYPKQCLCFSQQCNIIFFDPNGHESGTERMVNHYKVKKEQVLIFVTQR